MKATVIISQYDRHYLSFRSVEGQSATALRIKWTEELKKLGAKPGDIVEISFKLVEGSKEEKLSEKRK